MEELSQTSATVVAGGGYLQRDAGLCPDGINNHKELHIRTSCFVFQKRLK